MLFKDNIDDAPHPVGIVFGRRIGDNLNVVDGACRNLLQGVTAFQNAWPAVDQNIEIGGAAQADISLNVHLDRWCVFEHGNGRASLGKDILADVDDLFVDLELHMGFVSCNLHPFKVCTGQLKPDQTKVH